MQQRVPTDRLRHVAHLGVRARPFSYLVHGLDVPDRPHRRDSDRPFRRSVALGGRFARTGREPATVTGPALDFCLVVTQRGNVADTGLTISGDRAREWMSIAQAFAGPPGPAVTSPPSR